MSEPTAETPVSPSQAPQKKSVRCQTIRLLARSVTVPITIGAGLEQKVRDFCAELPRKGLAVVLSSPKIAQFHLDGVMSAVSNAGWDTQALLFTDREEHKSTRAFALLCERLAAFGADRQTLIVNLGGGVVTDLGGFVAASYMRGLRFINIPTTLLGQCDAAIGGKVGVNLLVGKNLVGAFAQPEAVFCDMNYLDTLAQDEFRNGLAEIIKCGMIADEALLKLLEKESRRILAREPGAVAKLVKRAVQLKVNVVSQDELDDGLRKHLNFGHTIGHALETATDYSRFKHGYAVAIGMVVETYIAEKLRMTEKGTLKRLEELLDLYELPRAAEDVDVGAVLEAVHLDKKNRDGKVCFVLPNRSGSLTEVNDVPVDLVREALNAVIVNFDW